MARSYLDPPIPIVALATAPARAALALIRATGPRCVELLAACFSRSRTLRAASGHRLVHGTIIDPGTREPIDEVLVTVFRAPHSPTGEEQVEISCHGSPAVWRRILECLGSAGFAPALPGEFSFRAFSNGRGDLVRAEAIDEIVSARSDGARAAALKRLEGGLSRRLEGARTALLALLAEAEVRLDHAEEDGSPAELFPRGRLRALRDDLAALVASWKAGRIYREGASLVLAGRTNAGKSSLFNLLLREERAIVSPEPGTTRDWIEAGLEIGGFPVRLVDTAGLREASGGVEAQGIERSRTLIAEADVVVCIVDAGAATEPGIGLDPEDEALLALRSDAIRVWNKIDLPDARPSLPSWLPLSARTGSGLPSLLAALEKALHAVAGFAPGPAPGPAALPGATTDPEAGLLGEVIANPRQKALLERAVAALDAALIVLEASTPVQASTEAAASVKAAGDGRGRWLDAATLELRDAADAIGEITGEIGSPEVLEAIFSGFCLGK
jgi:tRNA modification GTPase